MQPDNLGQSRPSLAARRRKTLVRALDMNLKVWIITRILRSLTIRFCGGPCRGTPRKPGRSRQPPRSGARRATRTRNAPFPTAKSSKRNYPMFVFESHGDFRKDEAARRAEASPYGVDRGFRRSARARNSRLGTNQDRTALGRPNFGQVQAKTTRRKGRTADWQKEFRAGSGKNHPVGRAERDWRNEFRASSGKTHPSEGLKSGLAEGIPSKFGQNPPVGRIEQRTVRPSSEQVRAKPTHREDRAELTEAVPSKFGQKPPVGRIERDWRNQFRASSGRRTTRRKDQTTDCPARPGRLDFGQSMDRPCGQATASPRCSDSTGKRLATVLLLVISHQATGRQCRWRSNVRVFLPALCSSSTCQSHATGITVWIQTADAFTL